MQPSTPGQNEPSLQTPESALRRETAASLVRQLAGPSSKDREAIERRLLQLGPDAVEPLVDLLHEQCVRLRKLRLLRAGSWICLVGSLWGSASFANTFYDWMFILLLFPASIILAEATSISSQRRVAQLLSKLDDVRAVGPLAEALELSDRQVRPIVGEALTHLLPRMQATDAGLLDKRQRDCLHRALQGSNHRLVLAVLAALKQVGDDSALPFVQKLAARTGQNARDREIREAAQECLSFLHLRIDDERAKQTLLRASAPEHTSPTLLRPAYGVGNQNPHQLLRPGGLNDSREKE